MKLTNIVATELLTTRFNYHADLRTFTAEASELRGNFLSRIWNDACDIGFVLRNPLTARWRIFFLSKVEKNAEGEVLSWTFTCHNDYTLHVTIWND